MSDDWFQRMLDIHVTVPFRVIRAAAPHLREPAKAERERGEEDFRKIVNVSSISVTIGNAGQANYSAVKSAVVGLTKTLAMEWGQFKVNVNAGAFARALPHRPNHAPRTTRRPNRALHATRPKQNQRPQELQLGSPNATDRRSRRAGPARADAARSCLSGLL